MRSYIDKYQSVFRAGLRFLIYSFFDFYVQTSSKMAVLDEGFDNFVPDHQKYEFLDFIDEEGRFVFTMDESVFVLLKLDGNWFH